jgi:hypothetical protein
VPLAPEEGIDRILAKPADRFHHLALERLPSHFSVSYDIQTGCYLRVDSTIDGAIFYLLELGGRDIPGTEIVPCFDQFRWAQETADNVGTGGNH